MHGWSILVCHLLPCHSLLPPLPLSLPSPPHSPHLSTTKENKEHTNAVHRLTVTNGVKLVVHADLTVSGKDVMIIDSLNSNV